MMFPTDAAMTTRRSSLSGTLDAGISLLCCFTALHPAAHRAAAALCSPDAKRETSASPCFCVHRSTGRRTGHGTGTNRLGCGDHTQTAGPLPLVAPVPLLDRPRDPPPRDRCP